MKPEGGGGRGGTRAGGSRNNNTGASGSGGGGGGLPSRVEQWFYKHGLFLSSYPTCATSVAIVLLLFCCYPLIYVPLPGTIPTKIDLPYRGGGGHESAAASAPEQPWNGTSDRTAVFFGFNSPNLTFEPPPPLPWGRQEPFVYVQQILFRVSVLPWTPDLILTDAYRGPFAEAFKLIEVVRNHQVPPDETTKTQRSSSKASSSSSSTSPLTLSDICLHVENVKVVGHHHNNHQKDPHQQPPQQLFPEYNCLLLSPANFWHQNAAQFNKDAALLNTIFQHHNFQKTKISVAEMLLGMKIRDSGIKRYPLRARSRVIQFAVTLMLTENNERFLQTLRDKLHDVYPLSGRLEEVATTPDHHPPPVEYVTWIYYPGKFNSLEFLPLIFTLALLFGYVYFSLKKMDRLRSRLILAIAAILTILGSLVMSLGFCFFFGLTISNQLKGIFPYLVVLVGLENVLVITKCVLSTDETLDVKIRVARGLSKEGWSIAKTLLTEITILTVGLATFVPFIQEFCIFAIVALICDFFLQMLLFSTILAMDIRPYNHHHHAAAAAAAASLAHGIQRPVRFMYLGDSNQRGGRGGEEEDGDDDGDSEGEVNHLMRYSSSAQGNSLTGGMARSQSHPKLSSMVMDGGGVAGTSVAKDVVATRGKGTAASGGVGGAGGKKKKKRIPKRLKIVNFWARTRFFQRCFMVWMIVWISMIIYNSGVIESYFDIHIKGAGGAEGDELRGKSEGGGNDGNSVPLSSVEIGVASEEQQQHQQMDNGRQRGRGEEIKFPNNNPFDDRFNYTEALLKLKFSADYETRDALSNFHWSSILRRYNVSLTGQYISILPSIRVSHLVTPEEAQRLRNPNEKSQKHNFQWKALAAALDPIDFSDVEGRSQQVVSGGAPTVVVARKDLHQYPYGTPLYPKSPMELFFAAILVCISVFVLTYTLIVMYRCICTRNYAEWRASWTDQAVAEGSGKRVQNVLQNSVPISIRGHHQSPIECLASDGSLVASSCLEGRINVWDVTSGIRISSIGRRVADGGDAAEKKRQQIWCLDFVDNLVAVGCADGRLEFWEGSTGNEKCTVESERDFRNGVTHIKLIGDQVIAARLCGRIDFLKLESYNHGKQIDWGFTSAYRRTHMRTGSTGSLGHFNNNTAYPNAHNQNKGINGEELRCTVQAQHQGHHQQPVTCMDVTRNLLFTGGQDHTLKVFRLGGTPSLQYTLHGHMGPITCLFIDQRDTPGSGGSGSQDGLLCLWELESGACVYGIQAHDGAVLALVASPSYLISLGADERMCVWERFQGHLLSSINITYAYSALLMLTPSLLLTSKPGALLVWDVRTGEPVKEVKLDCANSQLSSKAIVPAAADCVVCDFGNELRIVRFPLVAEKVD